MDGTIWDHFAIVRDPRIERKKKHQLKNSGDIILISSRLCWGQEKLGTATY